FHFAFDGGLSVAHKSGQVAIADVGLHENATTQRLATNLRRSVFNRQVGQLFERDLPTLRIGDFQGTKRFHVVSPLRCEANLQRKASLSFEYLVDDGTADDGDGVEHVAGVNTVAGDGVAANLNAQGRQAGRLFGLHVGGARDACDDARDF